MFARVQATQRFDTFRTVKGYSVHQRQRQRRNRPDSSQDPDAGLPTEVRAHLERHQQRRSHHGTTSSCRLRQTMTKIPIATTRARTVEGKLTAVRVGEKPSLPMTIPVTMSPSPATQISHPSHPGRDVLLTMTSPRRMNVTPSSRVE